MSLLQLQGSLNPGCSGGPVVGTDGKLCGVQVQTIRGSGLGFAIPTDEVVRLVQGRLATWRLSTKKDESGEYDVEYRVQLVDPMQKINSMELHYVPGAVPVPSVPEFKAAPDGVERSEIGRTETRRTMGRGDFQDADFRVGPVGRHAAALLDGRHEEEAGRPARSGAH